MKNSYTKLTKAIQKTKINATTVARTFFENWVASYGILSRLPTDYGTHFVPNFFVAVCITLAVENITITGYD